MTHSKSDKNFKTAQKILGGIIGFAFLAFIGTKTYPLIHGPEVSVPIQSGATVTNSVVHLSGVARYTKSLVIDGTAIALAPNGAFDEHVVLEPGYNTITVAARDRFGKGSSKTYAIVLNEPQTTAANIPPFNNQN
jgi:glucodextranase-like protein